MGNIVSNRTRTDYAREKGPKYFLKMMPRTEEPVPQETITVSLEPEPPCFIEAPVGWAFAHNPGTVADLHDVCRNTQPVPFEGLKMISNKKVHPQVLLGHQLQLCKKGKNVYRLNMKYTRDQRIHPFTGEPLSQLIGELDSRGGLTAVLNQFFNDRLRCKSTISCGCEGLEHYQVIADYFGNDYTFSCLANNLMPWQRSGLFVMSYLRRISLQRFPQPLELGWEFIWQGDAGPSLLSCVGRYSQGPHHFSGTLNRNATELCYTQSFGPYLRACGQLQANFLKRNWIGRLSYQLIMPSTHFTFRAAVDTRGVIAALCEKRLDPLPFLLVISGKFNHRSNRFRLGLGAVLE